MADGYIGEIRMIANNFVPKQWAACNGQLMSIQSNTALFSILGATYGGDGKTTFGLPDLRGRAPLAAGTGPGLSTYAIGQASGVQTVTLTQQQMPSHTHGLQGTTAASTGNVQSPTNNYLASGVGVGRGAASTNYYATGAAVSMAANSMSVAGAGGAHNNNQPYLGIMFIICTDGVFPPRP